MRVYPKKAHQNETPWALWFIKWPWSLHSNGLKYVPLKNGIKTPFIYKIAYFGTPHIEFFQFSITLPFRKSALWIWAWRRMWYILQFDSLWKMHILWICHYSGTLCMKYSIEMWTIPYLHVMLGLASHKKCSCHSHCYGLQGSQPEKVERYNLCKIAYYWGTLSDHRIACIYVACIIFVLVCAYSTN
jgi:hypothetical protein